MSCRVPVNGGADAESAVHRFCHVEHSGKRQTAGSSFSDRNFCHAEDFSPEYPASAQRCCLVCPRGFLIRFFRTSSTCVTSCRLAPVTTIDNGTPRSSTGICRLVPFFSPISRIWPYRFLCSRGFYHCSVDTLPCPCIYCFSNAIDRLNFLCTVAVDIIRIACCERIYTRPGFIRQTVKIVIGIIDLRSTLWSNFRHC